MRAPNVTALLLASSLALAAGSAAAQSSVPSDAPPKLETVQDGDTPITVTPRTTRENGTTAIKREGGQIREETVHSGGSTYTVKPANQNSTQLRGDAGGPQVRGAQWTVMEFDLNKKQKQRSADAAAAAENAEDTAPPPPAR